MKYLLIVILVVLAGCASKQEAKMSTVREVESLCVTGALAEYEGRTAEGWIKFKCRQE